MITEKAYAKMNLFLNVTDRRPDGYHDIESVMHAVDLFDLVNVKVKESGNSIITVETDAAELSFSEKNLAYIAAEKYTTKYGIKDEIKITLDKKIPIGAGLAGGSSDAAATLRALDIIYKKSNTEELLSLALEIGSDVPFCLVGGTAHCLGRGEVITPLCVKDKLCFVVAIGNERISTPKAFAELDARYGENFPDNTEMCQEMLAALCQGETISPFLYNVFEEVTNICSVKQIKETMIKNGAERTLMSGSGPSVFGVFKTHTDAQNAAESLLSLGYFACVAESVGDANITL